MIAIIWRYEILDEARAAFEAAYGPTGAWAQLFARSDGFEGRSELVFRRVQGPALIGIQGQPKDARTPFGGRGQAADIVG